MGYLTARLTRATRDLPGPVAVVDLDRFDANANDLLARAGGVPVRVASKSVRVRGLVERALGVGFAGVMTYSLREALWLAACGVKDVLMGYPSVDRDALAELAADPRARRAVTLMVDSAAHVKLLAATVGGAAGGASTDRPSDGAAGLPPVRVCFDVDASLRLGPVHMGARRSPVRTADDVARLATLVARTPGLRLRGLMTYEAQVAGLPDSSPAVRLMKRLSVRDVDRRRPELLRAARDAVGHEMELMNSGGTGSLETSAAGPGVTEVTAGSGLYTPSLFDAYRSFQPRPASFFGLDIVREPTPGWVTAFSGGYIASGPADRSRLPKVQTPGWSLSASEGAGEVQTPLRAARHRRPGSWGVPGMGTRYVEALHTGDRAWFRHAKAGELMERFDEVHLIRGTQIVDTIPTYRGEGLNFG